MLIHEQGRAVILRGALTYLAAIVAGPLVATMASAQVPQAPILLSGEVFPGPSNTGWAPTGVSLSAYTGPAIITTAGTVIDSKDITKCLTVQASNVTIKRSRIRCNGAYGIIQNSGSNLLVEDVEITSTSTGSLVDRAFAFGNGGGILRRAYIHDTQRGIAVGSNSTIEYSYVGDNTNNTDAHSSAIMTSGGSDHVIVRFNTLQTLPNTNASSAISFYPENWAGGANNDFLIEGNLLNSGGYYAVYLGHTPPEEQPNTNFRFINNRFGTLYFKNCGESGPVASWSSVSSNVWSGNTWYDLRPSGSGYTNKDGKTVTSSGSTLN